MKRLSPTRLPAAGIILLFTWACAGDGSTQFKDAHTAADAELNLDGSVDPGDAGEALDAGETPDGADGPPDLGPPPPDRDNDGIPDDEDPQPTRSNARLFRDDFDDLTKGWIFSSVSMAIDTHKSQLRVPLLEPYEREGWIGPRSSWTDYYVRTLVRLVDVGDSSAPQSGNLGIIARVNQLTPSRYLTCGVDIKRGKVILAEHEGLARNVLGSMTVTLPLNSWVLITLHTQNGYQRCTVGRFSIVGNSTLFLAGSVGFRSYDATFDADWLEVFEIN